MKPGVLASLLLITTTLGAAETPLRVGFATADITPDLSNGRPVWIAGYGHGRLATGVHDPLMARAAVLEYRGERIALVAVDLVGLQWQEVGRIREQLKDFSYVMVASTHNHEGPDVIGIWGPNPFRRGVDDAYLKRVINRCAEAVRAAAARVEPVEVLFGTAQAESLLRDSREPIVKDETLRVLVFRRPGTTETVGVVTQFSCHPESLGSRNTLLTADFPAPMIRRIEQELGGAVVHFSGAVGGLMTNPTEPIEGPDGRSHVPGTFAYAETYGQQVAERMLAAVKSAQPIRAVPFKVTAMIVTLPVENGIYRAAQELGVIQRSRFSTSAKAGAPASIASEVAVVKLGEVSLACIPGELYPELVYGRVQDPADAGADFPDAPAEPSVSQIMSNDKWLVIGLANDEVGYIIPKRQWDEREPFCYGRTKMQYGEINSCGPEAAPLIMDLLRICGRR